MTVPARVLLAEDDQAFSDELSGLLRSQGYEVQLARTADEAMTLLEQVVVTEYLRSYVRELTSFFEQVQLIVNKPCPPRELAATVTALVPG
jgi:DNA-binding response OmpR family regulator